MLYGQFTHNHPLVDTTYQ
ncbi:hypothetical protein MJO28_005350 [Puccinia striiformis f. sp. tritici]|uniref:Uncharacterized protein n=1 Tax=Puccinia striiformis f. sp. tritici TaxID=168172 RepID=A0ACC0EKM5_9BASI|nr:hypothetical protein MJO28_005350 [Puccinia striiformis f. sp. tritici]